MMSGELLVVFSAAKLLLATWLFARTLPWRDGGPARGAVAGLAFLALALAAAEAGFSLYPPLTDDRSYVLALGSFLVVLVVMVTLVRLVWECSAYASIFCCSMAFSLETLSTDLDRIVSTTVLGVTRSQPLWLAIARYWAVSAVVFAAAYLLLVRRVEAKGLVRIEDKAMLLVAVVAIGLDIVFNLALKDLAVLDGVPRRYVITFQAVYLGMCVFVMYSEYEVIYNRRLQLGMLEAEQLRQQSARQYEASLENMAAINAKCHAIRHRVAHLENDHGADRAEIAAIVREIDIYDSKVRTGNEALDVVIGERRLSCERWGITLACIADGRALAFMRPADLGALVGGALDAAIACARSVGSREARRISLNASRAMGMASVHVEAPVGGSVRTSDGFPESVRTPDGERCLDNRALRMVAASYDALLSSKVIDHVLHINIMIPEPDGATSGR